MAVLPTGIGPVTGYNIERSLRFDGAAYLNRTFTTPTANTTWSWSCWLKRSTLATTSFLLGLSSDCGFGFTSTDELRLWNNAGTTLATSTAVFRDTSAWYHIVFISNGTTIKGYVNNVEYLSYTGTVTNINSAVVHNIGRDPTGTRFYVGGYLTEVYFIDGSAKTSSDFGQYNGNTGVWEPKAYSGTYGNNGFYLKFADNSGTTATTLGKDSSGNGNNWTPNNFSVTAGTGNDSLVDTPTPYGTDTGVGGEVRGNYCTLNPLDNPNTTYAVSQNGNLYANLGTGAGTFLSGTMHVLGGKYYWEFTPTSVGNGLALGITYGSTTTTDANSKAIFYSFTGGKRIFGTDSAYGASYAANDVIGVAVDGIAGTIEFFKNGTSQGVITNSTISLQQFRPFIFNNSSSAGSLTFCNFGQRPFEKWNGSAYVANTAPSGFKALCTTNLPTPTIGATSTTQADNYFDIGLVTGSSSVDQTITTAFAPDFYWSKSRNDTLDHGLYNTIVGGNKYLSSNTTTAETTSTANIVTFNSTGVSLKAGGSIINDAPRTYVGWLWRGGGTGVTNTAGSITSTVSANTTSGFSIVTYTGTGANATVGHGLGVAPDFIIIKDRTAARTTDQWPTYHRSIGATGGLVYLNSNNGGTAASVVWNNTNPTSSVFSIGTWGGINYNTDNFVAYCFAAVPGYSAFGSYAGNGTTTGDGPFIYTGFRPAFVMLKAYIGSGENWAIYDKSRIGYNSSNYVLFPNLPNIENAATTHIDLLSNGFKLRSGNQNLSSYSYIYAAFAESPFKYSLAR